MGEGNTTQPVRGRRPWRTVSARLLILALAILIPFQVVGVGLIMHGRDAIKGEIKASAMSATRALSDMLERELLNVQRQIDALITNESMQHFMLNPDALPPSVFYMDLLAHFRLLRSAMTGSPFIRDITVYYRGFDKANSALRGYASIAQDEMERALEALSPAQGLFRRYGDSLVMGGVYPQTAALAAYTGARPAYVVMVMISTDTIEDLLSAASGEKTTVLYSHALDGGLAQSGAAVEDDQWARILAGVTAAGRSDTEFSSGGLYTVSVYSPLLDCSIVQIILEATIFDVPYNYTLFMLLFTVAGMLALVLYSVISNRLIKRPVRQMLDAFARIEAGHLGAMVSSPQMTQEFSELVSGFNQMSSRLGNTVEALYARETYAHSMELKQLQAQINPHFLYNTYFLLHRLIAQEDTEAAVRLSRYLGEYFQYITRNDDEKAALRSEWQHAVNYLEIQAMRFSDRLTLAVDPLPDDVAEYKVPRLIIQPILENAIQYGLSETTDQESISLLLTQDEAFLRITIINTGKPLSDEAFQAIVDRIHGRAQASRETTAITNIHRRLWLWYGRDSGLTAERNPQGGLIVTLNIANHAPPQSEDEAERGL